MGRGETKHDGTYLLMMYDVGVSVVTAGLNHDQALHAQQL